MNRGARLTMVPVNLARFASAVLEGLTIAQLAERFGLSVMRTTSLRKQVMRTVPGWKAKTGMQL